MHFNTYLIEAGPQEKKQITVEVKSLPSNKYVIFQ